MAGERPTKEIARVGERDTVEVYLDARAGILRTASQLRRMGLGLQADLLDEVAGVLVPPTFRGILARLEDHRQVSPKDIRFLVGWMTEGSEIVRELMEDAEITNSTDATARAVRWLDQLGL